MFIYAAGVGTYLNTVHKISMCDCGVVCLHCLCQEKKLLFNSHIAEKQEPGNDRPFAPPSD